jgi:protein SDA1
MQRYLTSHQKDVTFILAYLIQGCHDLVPPEELMPVIKAIAYNFITERCTNEVIAVGINSVREIIARIPSILREPDMDDFITDLAQYSRKTHKSVMTAAHGVVNLVRELYPTLLKKGDRGKFHDVTNIPNQYGDQAVADGVAGAELLDAYERGEIEMGSDDELRWKEDMEEGGEDSDEEGWEECSNSDDDEEAPDLVEIKRKTKLNTKMNKQGCDENMEVEDEEGWAYVSCDEDDNDEQDDGEDEGWEDVEEGDDEEEEEDDEDEEEDEEENEEEDEEGSVEEVEVEVEGEKKVVVMKKDIRQRVDATRILTAEDFQLLERLREAQAERAMNPKNRSKNSAMQKTQERKRQRYIYIFMYIYI